MLAGLIIGIGMILPGVSGGVLAVILGIYDKLIYCLNNFKSDIKGNIKFLLPIIFGLIIGSVISANILKFVFETYYVEVCYLFIGLILGFMMLFRTRLPAPTTTSSHTLTPLAKTAWLPIKQLSPTLQSPLTIVPVDIWH